MRGVVREVLGALAAAVGEAEGAPSDEAGELAAAMVAGCPQLLMLDAEAVRAAMRHLEEEEEEEAGRAADCRARVRADPTQLLYAALQHHAR
jgi:hypothetical protein